MTRKKYLLDESIFVYLDRGEDQICSQLAKFLEDGRLSRRFTKQGRAHELYMPMISKYRLGGTFFYRFLISLPRFGNEDRLHQAKKQSHIRLSTAKNYINRFKRLKWYSNFSRRWKLMDLYIDANTKKSQYVLDELERKMLPSEIIPFDMCEAALVAKQENMELISFNDDYRFLFKLTDRSVVFTYHPAKKFLERYHSS